jgi:RHS repeat-associated protein
MKYNHSATQDNGRILSQTDVVSGETITYQYDTLNRLIQANGSGDPSGSWSQGFSYDGFGNLTAKSSSNAPGLAIAVDPLTNRIQAGGGYDSNGNLTNYGGATYVYDIANRIGQANPAGGASVVYGYDSRNRRIYKANLSGSTYSAEELYFYGIDGKKYGIWKINPTSGVYLQATVTKQWFGGRLLSPEDRLSSKGKYFPYGEDRIGTTPANPPPDQEKFATYTRDAATGLDYADQRYFTNVLGRFMSPDPFRGSARLTSPQSWNRYAYAEDDPINGLDPTGLGDRGADATAFFSNPGFYYDSVDPGTSAGSGDWQLFSSGTVQADPGTSYTDSVINPWEGTQVTSTITFQSDSSFLDSAASAIGNWLSSPQGQATTAVVLAIGAVALLQPELLVPAFEEASSAAVLLGVAGAAAEAESPALETSTAEALEGAATRAAATVGEGSGALYGTAVHTNFNSEVAALGNEGLNINPSYLNGKVVPYGTAGSVRPDIVEGPVATPHAIWDLKTGSANLSSSWISRVRGNLPAGSENIPIRVVRPRLIQK